MGGVGRAWEVCGLDRKSLTWALRIVGRAQADGWTLETAVCPIAVATKG